MSDNLLDSLERQLEVAEKQMEIARESMEYWQRRIEKVKWHAAHKDDGAGAAV